MDVENVRMRERGDGARLALEARVRRCVGGEPFRKNLDRHFAVQPRVARPVNLAHPSRADQREHFIRTEAVALAECHRT